MTSPADLQSIQAAFARALLDDSHAPPPGVFVNHGLTARRRVNVYRNNHASALEQALAAVYPAVQRLVGEEFFANMGAMYAQRYPPLSGDIRDFGGRLAQFISDFAPLEALPYIADVAALEWACHEALHAPRAHPCDPCRPWDGCDAVLVPSARLMRSPYPVARIWDFALRDHAHPDVRLDIADGGTAYILVFRAGLGVEVMTLAAEDWHWLARFDTRRPGPAGALDSPFARTWIARGVLIATDQTPVA